MPACPKHKTDTVDTAWDAGANEKRLPDDADKSTLQKMYAWVPEGDSPTKSASKFPHHEVSESGVPGAANLNGCQAGFGRLNQSDISEGDKDGVHAHLSAHYMDAGKEPPERSASGPIETRVGKKLGKANRERVEKVRDLQKDLRGLAKQAHDLAEEVLNSDNKDDGEEESKGRAAQWYQAEPRKRSVPQSQIEYRTFRVEYRTDRTTGKPRITGHAAMFNQETEVYDWWMDDTYIEDIAPGAFAKTIREADVRMLFNHNPDWILGRSKPGKASTLRLSEDAVGLAIDNDPPETQLVNDLVLVPMERGDLDQMSFAFRVIRHEIIELGNRKFKRRLLEVELFDTSIVTYPQYELTHAEVVHSAFADAGIDMRSLGPELIRRMAGLPVNADALRSSLTALRSLLPEGAKCGCGRCKSEPAPEITPVPPVNPPTVEAEASKVGPTPPADVIPPSPAAPTPDSEPGNDHSEDKRETPTLAGQPSEKRARRLKIAEAEAYLLIGK